METSFIIIAALTVAAAVAAMSLRNLVHCALALAVAFTGLAAVFLQLDAQFVGFAQILVYVGAVSILVVFAILLTRGGESAIKPVVSNSAIASIGVTVVVLGLLTWAIANSFVARRSLPPLPEATVKQIGVLLMDKYILPLEVIGLLLTAALIGAVIIAMHDKSEKTKTDDGGLKMDKPSAPSSILHPPSSQGGHE